METALGASELGYDVYGLMDAAGDTSPERHNYGVQRMLRSGITPLTWMSLASEWMNGWAAPAESFAEETGKYSAILSYLSR
jgi:nicotinamidase-related amidase